MFCVKCGNEIPEGGKFCVKCGAIADETSAQQTFANAVAVPATPKKKNKIKFLIIAAVAVVLTVLIAYLFKVILTPSSFKGNEDNPDALIKVANKYLSSDEYKYCDEGYINYDEAINFVGKLGDYYQFQIVGKTCDEETGEVLSKSTEDDGSVMVLTETEDGIEGVPLSKSVVECDPTSENYEYYKSVVTTMQYDYETGNLIACVRLKNPYTYDYNFTGITIEIFDENSNDIIAEGTFELNEQLSPGECRDKIFTFVNFEFVDDLSSATWRNSYPLFKGNEDNPDALIKVANNYLSSDKFKYGDDGCIKDYETINFNGKLGDYYEFQIVGKYYNEDTGKEYDYTEDDNQVMVLTETEDGIGYIPVSKWWAEWDPEDENYKSETSYVTDAFYDYETGDLIAYVSLKNPFIIDHTFTVITIKIYDENSNDIIAEGAFALNEQLSPGECRDKVFTFENSEFVDDLSSVTWDANAI